jgi:hypothetical protein
MNDLLLLLLSIVDVSNIEDPENYRDPNAEIIRITVLLIFAAVALGKIYVRYMC